MWVFCVGGKISPERIKNSFDLVRTISWLSKDLLFKGVKKWGSMGDV